MFFFEKKNQKTSINFYTRTAGADELAVSQNRWIVLIKKLRQEHGLGIAEAEAKALESPVWRQWVEARVNSDPECRKTAIRHIRERGAAALLTNEGGTMKIRPKR